MKRQYLTKNRPPDNSGIYIFRDKKKRPLYIGRATSLKNRIPSYFKDDLIDTRGPRIVDMVTKAVSITWQETETVLEAVLLESEQIKRYQPFYNVDERDDKSAQYVVITNEEWPRVFLARVRDFDKAEKDGKHEYQVLRKFGPFVEGGVIKESLRILRKMFPFRDKKSVDPRHESFYRAIGRSPNNDGDASRMEYRKTITYLIMFFEGEKKYLRANIERDMKKLAKEMKFEEADRAKKLLYSLDHINDMTLLKREKTNGKRGNRIEAYDIAHLSGTNVVGVMTVLENGEYAKAEYRKFKISKQTNNDIAGLMEVLSRRLNHSEWQYPDIIVVDGNEVQMRAAEGVLAARRISIPVIAVTKDERHKARLLLGHPDLISKYKKDIISLNAEAHRFAITYHRSKRSLFSAEK